MTHADKEKATLAGAAFKNNLQDESYQNQALEQEKLDAWLSVPVGQWAQVYLDHGFAVFPCHGVSEDLRCTCGKQPCGENNKQAGKHPFTRNGVKDASKDIGKISAMFRYRTDLNIAIATGELSGVFVVDRDVRGDVNGEESISELEKVHGQISKTLRSITGNGTQDFFKMPSDFDVKNATGIVSGVDIRGTGGYVIAQPSRHYTGRVYEFDDSSFDAGIAEAPVWLLDMLRPKPKPVRELSHDYASGATPEWSKEEVLRMLEHISPDIGYQEWVEVGMALNDGGYPLSVWDNWSRGGQKYENKCCEVRWRGFGKQDGITMGTLVSMAQLNGWRPEPIVHEQRDTSLADAFVKGLEQKPEPVHHPKPLATFDPMKLEGLIGDTVRWIVSDAMLPQPMLALLHTLAFAGAVFGRRYASPINTRTNVYFAAVANTASGKNHSRVKLPILAEAAGLGEFIGAHGIISDTGVARSLMEKPCQLLMLDEWGLVLQAIGDPKAPSHGKKIKSLLMTLYSDSGGVYMHGDYANKKLNESIVIHSPNLCIYGTTTEKEYVKALSKDAVESGELNRVMAIKVDSVLPHRVTGMNPPPQDLIDRWERFSQNSYSLVTNGTVKTNPKIVSWGECDDLQWSILSQQHDLVNSASPSSALWGRRHENIIKIAMIFAIARNKEVPEFCPNDFTMASYIVDESIQYMAMLSVDHMADNGHEAQRQQVAKFIKEHGKKGVMHSVVTKRFRSIAPKDFEAVIKGLLGEDTIKIDGGQNRPHGGGCRGTIYRYTGG